MVCHENLITGEIARNDDELLESINSILDIETLFDTFKDSILDRYSFERILPCLPADMTEELYIEARQRTYDKNFDTYYDDDEM